MGQRKFRALRCRTCGLHTDLCVCALMPQVEVDFDIVVIQNNHERNKPTNTGRLIPEMIVGSRLQRYAVRGEVFDESRFEQPEVDYRLLFPREESGTPAPVLDSNSLKPAKDGRRRGLVILDGTWGQCSRMSRRIKTMAAMPAYTLNPGAPGHWNGIRESADPDRLCTFEAMIRVLETIEASAAARALQIHFDRIVAAMMFMKGKSRSPEVPEAWQQAWQRESLGGER